MRRAVDVGRPRAAPGRGVEEEATMEPPKGKQTAFYIAAGE